MSGTESKDHAESANGSENALTQRRRRTLGQRLRRLAKPPRKLKFTRMGKWYLAFTLVLGLAAINTGNNLLFLILGLLLAGIILSGVLSESTLRGLSVQRFVPLDPSAGKPSLVGIRLVNSKRRTASYAVVARDFASEKVIGGRTVREAGLVFALKVDPQSHRDLAYTWIPQRRGRVDFERVELSTRFPFGLFEKSREVAVEAALVVFPREVPAPPLAPRRSSQLGERPSGLAGPGTEYFALREARPGDDSRSIHWASTARRGRPVVVERERERRRQLAIRVDNRVPSSSSSSSSSGVSVSNGSAAPSEIEFAVALENAVEQAAALARRARMEGCEVALTASGVIVPTGASAGHERRMLRELALLEPAVDGPAPGRVPGADVLDVPVRPPSPGRQEAA